MIKDKAYTYPHDNPEITTGTMAAYRGPKPKHRVDYFFVFGEKTYEPDIIEWQSSRLAYIKEPGFKVGDMVYCDGKKWELTEIHDKGYNLKRDNRITNGKMSFKIAQLSEISRYHEGREIDLSKFKYVEIKSISLRAKPNSIQGREVVEWKEVKEPDKINPLSEFALITKRGKLLLAEWEQFPKGKREGTILLEEIKYKQI